MVHDPEGECVCGCMRVCVRAQRALGCVGGGGRGGGRGLGHDSTAGPMQDMICTTHIIHGRGLGSFADIADLAKDSLALVHSNAPLGSLGEGQSGCEGRGAHSRAPHAHAIVHYVPIVQCHVRFTDLFDQTLQRRVTCQNSHSAVSWMVSFQ